MGRGLPWSIMLHLVAVAMIAAWGGHVPQPPLEPQRVLRVQIARMPAAKPQVSQPAPQPEAEPVVPVDEPPPPAPKPVEQVLPPKEVPRKPEPKKPEPEKPKPDVAPAPKPEPEAPPVQTEPEPEAEAPQPAAGPAVSGTDVDFPFAWYLNSVEGIIARNWKPRQLGFREGSARGCVVHFIVNRSGQVSQVALVKSSGVSLFDREALRAVKAGRLPPLPAKFPHRALGVTFVFTLESGM